jgi:ketosteroid isomerase-like protein
MTTQNRLSPVTLVTYILLIGITTPASAGDIPAWAQEQLLTPWYAAYNAEDANGLADLYTSDARTGTANGRSEIIANFESDWAENDSSCSGVYDGFQIVGDLATGWGHDTCIETPKSGGESQTEHIRWLAVYERQADGTWLCSREIGEPAD